MSSESRREKLLTEIQHLARVAIVGSLSETFRTCGNASCRCHTTGPKHGPHTYVSYRSSETRKTAGYYVPADAVDAVRNGIAAWKTVQLRIKELAELNQQRALSRGRVK
jgi:hypothetical protein